MQRRETHLDVITSADTFDLISQCHIFTEAAAGYISNFLVMTHSLMALGHLRMEPKVASSVYLTYLIFITYIERQMHEKINKNKGGAASYEVVCERKLVLLSSLCCFVKYL